MIRNIIASIIAGPRDEPTHRKLQGYAEAASAWLDVAKKALELYRNVKGAK